MKNAELRLSRYANGLTDPARPTQLRPHRHGVVGRTLYDATYADTPSRLCRPGCHSRCRPARRGLLVEEGRAATGRRPLIQQSIAATKALKSAHLEIAITGKIEGLPVKTLTGDLTNVPTVAVQGKSTITMGGSDVDVQLIVVDGTLYAALTPNQWLDMGPAAEIYDPSVILNPDSGGRRVGQLDRRESRRHRDRRRVSTVRITGKAGAEAVNKVIPQLKASGPVTATVWIEKDDPHQLVQAKVDQSEGNSVSLTLSEWDKPVTVTKPAL